MDYKAKEEFTEADIKSILDSKLEESINIEFKSGKALSTEQSVKKEISKDVSAFANSDGGIIFYGIEEENHIASSFSFVDGNKFTKEWLENVITSNIQQRIDGLKIFPVRFNNDILQTIYVVKIPKSPYDPHINSDKKYYKRFNFQSVPMEEYEVRKAYLKDNESKVIIEGILVKPLEFDKHKDTHSYRFHIEAQISNSGEFMSEKYKIACNILAPSGSASISYETDKEYTMTNKLQDGIKISTTKMIPLFPNELLTALVFQLHIEKNKFDEVIDIIQFDFLIFSVGELYQAKFDLSTIIKSTKEQHYNHR